MFRKRDHSPGILELPLHLNAQIPSFCLGAGKKGVLPPTKSGSGEEDWTKAFGEEKEKQS